MNIKALLFSVLILGLANSAFALENRTRDLPLTDVPSKNQPTIAQFCENVIGNSGLDWGKRSKVSCQMIENGIIQITGHSVNREGIERSLTISANASDIMYMEESGDIVYKYMNDQNEILLLNTRFVSSGVSYNRNGVEMNGQYQGDLILSKGNIRVRVGFTDLQ
jgi:hypothetical protein